MAEAVYLTISDRPQAVVSVMDTILERQESYESRLEEVRLKFKQRRRVVLVLVLLAIPFCALDVVLDYGACVFSLVSVFLLLAAAYVFHATRRPRTSGHVGFANLPQHYGTARTVLHTLRDDVARKQNYLGHLDLTGAEKPEKLVQTSKNASGLAVEHYRDEWLSLKCKLYDGNVLRLSLIEQVKKRVGYRKRSRSGKMKWKPPKMKNEQQLKVRLTVNPDIYTVVRTPEARVGTKIGAYTIEQLEIDPAGISLSASSPPTTVSSGDVLGVLKLVYSQLQQQRRAA